MNCKFCNAEIQEDYKVCPYCGKSLEEEETSCCEVTTLPIPEEVIVEETPKKKVWPLVLAIVGAVAALGVLAVVLLTALGVKVLPRANDIHKKDSYTLSQEKASQMGDVVVATINGNELTNTQLQIYYRMQVVDFANYYSSYISQLGIDFSKPLSEQQCYFDDTLTWEQYFLEIAIETWQNYQTLAVMGEQAGHTLGADWQKSLDELPTELEAQAKEDGYETIDALLAEVIGPGCTLESYMEHIRLTYYSNEYYNTQYDKLTPTDEEVEAYFDANADSFAMNGITKDSGLISSVRHILFEVQGTISDDEEETVTYTEKDWEDCLARAEKVKKEWQEGEATEESFVELVKKYSADTASISTGGLYEGIYLDSGMTEEFQNWSIDPVRKPGDVGLVRADYDHYKGYHLIYFVSGEPHWLSSGRTNLLSERTTELLEGAKETWPMEIRYSKIALAELKID